MAAKPCLCICEATSDDAPGMARVRVDTWRSAHRGVVAADHLARLSYAHTEQCRRTCFFERGQPGEFVFAEHAQVVVGIAVGGAEGRRDPVYPGEVYVLYDLPSYQNRGIGRQLLAACMA